MEKELSILKELVNELSRQIISNTKTIIQLEEDRNNLILAVASLTEILRRLDFELQEGESPDFKAPGDTALLLKAGNITIKPLTMDVDTNKDNSEIIFKFTKLDHEGAVN